MALIFNKRLYDFAAKITTLLVKDVTQHVSTEFC